MSEKTYFLTESTIEAIKAKAREEAISECIKIISEMQTNAEAGMLWEYAKACDLITAQLKQIKEQSK